MRQIFKIFFQAEGTSPWLVLLCLLFGGLVEAIGIGSLLPLAGALLQEGGGGHSIFERYFTSAINSLGIVPTFANLIPLLVGLMVLRSLLLFAAMTYAGMSGARVTIGLRRRLIKSIFDARWSFYSSQSGGAIATAISNDATRAGDAYITSATAATSAVQISAYAVIALLINWRVALAGAAGGLVLGLVSSRLVGITRRSGYKQTDRVRLLTSDMVDMLQNIKALKSMNRYDALIDSLSNVLKKLKRTLYTQYIARNALLYGNDSLLALMIGAGAWIANRYAEITLPELMVLGILFFQVISYISKFAKQLQMAAQFEAAHVRVSELIGRANAEREPPAGGKVPAIGKGCRFENVSFSHGEKPTVANIDLEIPAHQITVLQGPSGAGKTTIIDLLIGLHRAQSGSVFIGEDRLEDIDLGKWRQMIGYVPQELALFHDTIRENITLAEAGIAEDDIRNAMLLSGAAEFVDNLPKGIETDVGELGSRLSGGQRQRISLARALVRNPQVLVLDEVTSALDPETEAGIVHNIKKLRGAYTIIVITHRPAWTTIADRLYEIENGRVKSSTLRTKRAIAKTAKS